MTAPWKSYAPIFGKGALAGLYGHIPNVYFECIHEAIVKLASDPTALSERCGHPYPGTKIHHFDCKHGDHGFIFRVHFFFEPGETQIRIFDVTAISSW